MSRRHFINSFDVFNIEGLTVYIIYIAMQCELVYIMPNQIIDVICEHEPVEL